MTASKVITPQATQEEIDRVLEQLAWTIDQAKREGRNIEVTVAPVVEHTAPLLRLAR